MAKKTKRQSTTKKLNKEQLLTLYRNLVRIEQWDKCYMRRMKTGRLVGFYHPGEGALAPGVGACSFLRKDDILWGHVRTHGQAHMLSKGIDLKYYLAEHTGKATGCCGGRSSYHASFPEDGVFGSSGCIGANFPPSVGWGLACKKNGREQVVMNCFGDGGSNRGTLHEAFLIANNWKLPIVYLCENNGLAIYSKAEDMHPTDDIADLAKGYGMPALIVDGQDVIAVAEAAQTAIAHARSGKGPYFIEAKTTRFHEHDIGTPDLAGYVPRSEEEIAELRKREPVAICRERLLSDGVLTQELIDQFEEEAITEVADGEKFADESSIAELDLSDINKLVYAD